MAYRNVVVGRTTSGSLPTRVTVRIVGQGSNPLLAGDCIGDALPVIVIDFDLDEMSRSIPLPVKPGTGLGKGFRVILTDPDPVPVQAMPAAISETVGYEASSARTGFYVDPVFDEPMY